MSMLLTTLPGDIPGLLRRGSPVLWRDEQTPWTVTWIGPWPDSDTTDDGAIALIAPAAEPVIGMAVNAYADLVLDLSDPTGRAHAAAWAWKHPNMPANRFWDGHAVHIAQMFADMTPEQIDTLARLVLRLAGREP